MNVEKTVEYLKNICESYIDPDLLIREINDDYFMGSDENITIDSLKHSNLFINFGLLAFAPIINECDIYSTEDYTVKLSKEEFDSYGEIKDEYFGILIEKNSSNFIIGTCDVCGCKTDSSFHPLRSKGKLYEKLSEIVNQLIIE